MRLLVIWNVAQRYDSGEWCFQFSFSLLKQVRDDSVACLILRDGLAYYCASINREERPIFVVRKWQQGQDERTERSIQSAKLAQCQHILSIRVKEKCNNKLSFWHHVWQQDNFMIYDFKFQIYGKGKETFEPESDSGVIEQRIILTDDLWEQWHFTFIFDLHSVVFLELILFSFQLQKYSKKRS